MRVIKNRIEFLKNYKNNKIDEALANEVNWGDSLLGRLINSSIRKAGISVNLSRIGDILENLEVEFDRLSSIIKISSDSIELVKSIEYKTMFGVHISEIRKAIEDEMDVDGLIKLTNNKIKTVKSYKTNNKDVDSLKNELVTLLQEFLDYLNSISNGLVDSEDSKMALGQGDSKMALGQGDSKMALGQGDSKMALGHSKGEIGLIKDDIKKLINDIEKISIEEKRDYSEDDFNRVWRSLQLKTHPDRKSLIPIEVRNKLNVKLGQIRKLKDMKSIIEFNKYVDELIDKYSKLYSNEKEKDDNKNISLPQNTKGGFKEIYNKLLDDYIEVSGEEPSDEKKKELEEQAKSKANESVIRKYNLFLEEKIEGGKNKTLNSEISDEFESIFSEFSDKIIIEDNEDLESKVKESTDKQIPIDPVIEIVRLFNRAYRIHTPGVIPSGRSGGKVSNSVFREYEYIGSGGSPTADTPGPGPFRNIKLFDKWREGVFSIINKSNYQVIFNEKTSFKIGDADKRKNITKDGSKVKQGGGKTLLTFINSMLNSSDGYRSGAQSKFIAEYFNVKLDDKELNSPGFSDTEKNKDTANKVDDSLKFERSDVTFKNNIIFRILKDGSSDRYYYFRVIESKDNETYLLFSLGNPFDLGIELDIIEESNNLIFSKTSNKKIDGGFVLKNAFFIKEDGTKGNEAEYKLSENGLKNPEILKRGNKVYSSKSLIDKEPHKKIWDEFSSKFEGKLELFFE